MPIAGHRAHLHCCTVPRSIEPRGRARRAAATRVKYTFDEDEDVPTFDEDNDDDAFSADGNDDEESDFEP